MIVKENVNVYICEHCKRKMFRKHAMALHEPACFSNPENKRACSGCEHLQQIEILYYFDHFDGEHEAKTKGFKCNKLDKIMYPYKVEKMGLNTMYPESFEDQIPMPKECEYFDSGFNFSINK